MNAQTRARRFSERTIKQVRLDCTRALSRANLNPQDCELTSIRCMDDVAESEQAFGSQLWYFEGHGTSAMEPGRRHSLYGVVEYSLQFGLHELVEDGVFDSNYQRERFRDLYDREVHRPTWRHPAHRWLALGVIAVASLSFAYLLVRSFTA